jgi:hypothetical protein
LDELLTVISHIRTLSTRRPHAQFIACELGTRPLLNAFDAFVGILEQEHYVDSNAIERALDASVAAQLVPLLTACGTQALEAIRSEIFGAAHYVASRARIETLLAEQSIY